MQIETKPEEQEREQESQVENGREERQCFDKTELKENRSPSIKLNGMERSKKSRTQEHTRKKTLKSGRRQESTKKRYG